jgi:hypothetical protein
VPGKDAQEQRPRFVPGKERQGWLACKFNPIHGTTRTFSPHCRGRYRELFGGKLTENPYILLYSIF